MSYTVLARKWRPQNFQQLVGQEHVQRAIVNAIDQDRLHHAYLFTGTRGVGKTTIARIFSKCLNCDQGISSNPCGECDSCYEIEQGRYVDLLEIDAASRTKVEDTRELLDNVQYRPTRGRYKVYLIDEVHMLSTSSFNALLKTLEEPPPHVVFLLATTDPQKLPVTVLSRCLQFHLKRMEPQSIIQHLSYLLEQEQIDFEKESLPSIAKAADGSMRDALSLLDQAIAFGGGKLTVADVASMLGSIDQHHIESLIVALGKGDAKVVMSVIANMAEFAPDYRKALGELLSWLHQIAVAQMLGEHDNERIKDLAEQLSSDLVQLFYQLGLQARRDLPLAPDPREGFEMAMLRILAFRPIDVQVTSEDPVINQSNSSVDSEKKKTELDNNRIQKPSVAQQAQKSTEKEPTENPLKSPHESPQEKPQEKPQESPSGSVAERSISKTEPRLFENTFSDSQSVLSQVPEKAVPAKSQDLKDSQDAKNRQNSRTSADLSAIEDPILTINNGLAEESVVQKHGTTDETISKHTLVNDLSAESNPSESTTTSEKSTENSTENRVAEKTEGTTIPFETISEPNQWHQLLSQLELTGTHYQILNNSCAQANTDGQQATVKLQSDRSIEHFVTESSQNIICQALSKYFQQPISINIEYTDDLTDTPKLVSARNLQMKLETTRQSLLANKKFASLVELMGVELRVDDLKLK